MKKNNIKNEATKVIGIKGRDKKVEIQDVMNRNSATITASILFVCLICYLALGGVALGTILGPKAVEAVIFFLI